MGPVIHDPARSVWLLGISTSITLEKHWPTSVYPRTENLECLQRKENDTDVQHLGESKEQLCVCYCFS